MSIAEVKEKQQELYDRFAFECPIIYLTCNKATCGLPIVSKYARYPKWCLSFYCASCKRSWNICMICVNNNKHYKCLSSLKEKKLHTTLHEEESENLESTVVVDDEENNQRNLLEEKESETDDIYEDGVFEETDTEDVISNKRKLNETKVDENRLKDVLGDGSLFQFFKYNIQNLGKNYLLSKQLEKTDGTSNIASDDVNLHVLLSYLFFRLTRTEKELFL